MRRAFTTIELLTCLGIVAVIAGLIIPMYRNYQIVSDLDLAKDTVVAALTRAKLLSQLREQDSPWGFSSPNVILYRGENFATRDASFDELYSFSPTIEISGLPEVFFAPLTGIPSATGAIVLTAINGSVRTIWVTGDMSGVEVEGEWGIAICHYPPGSSNDPHVLKVPEAAWPAHKGHGDTTGPCPDDEDDD